MVTDLQDLFEELEDKTLTRSEFLVKLSARLLAKLIFGPVGKLLLIFILLTILIEIKVAFIVVITLLILMWSLTLINNSL